jgi:hypothetical protein
MKKKSSLALTLANDDVDEKKGGILYEISKIFHVVIWITRKDREKHTE